LQRTLNNIGSNAFLIVLSDKQIQTVREYLLASPSTIEFNITENEEIILHKEIETINFDSFKSLDLTKKQQIQLKTIYKKFEPKLFTLMKRLVNIQYQQSNNDKKTIVESIDETNELLQKTKIHILNILTDKQKSKIENLKELKL
jgi:hypothetical protein